MIQSYFAQIKDIKGILSFVDGSTLHFTEYLDTVGQSVQKLMYTYHYQE
ncbi:MAG: toxin-antitoxin system TumE family protein [Ardenticatenaceae bacterium]